MGWVDGNILGGPQTNACADQMRCREADERVSAVPRSGELMPTLIHAPVAHLAMPGDEIEIRRQPGNRKTAKQVVDEGRLAVEIGVEREAGRHFRAVLPGKQ